MGKLGGRTRTVAVLSAVIGVVVGGGLLSASASSPDGAVSSFVPITACRLLDTRTTTIGPRHTPLDPRVPYVATVWGANGNCTIPATATAVSMNVTAINPTNASYLTVYAADQDLPLSSNLNFVAGQPATPNAVTTQLSADGKITFYNNAGTVDVAADIVGYYVAATGGATGPKGDTGAQGPKGDTGATGDTGPQGDAGAAGATGPQGPEGDVGPIGPQGPEGDVGSIGPEGDLGPIGPQGPEGDVGPIGPQGPEGDVGPIGPQGPAGSGSSPDVVVTVATSGGDFPSVSLALASITDASAAKPYLIKVAPGTYAEPAGIVMKDWVSLEGSGQNGTTLETDTFVPPGIPTVSIGANIHTEISNLSLENSAGPGATSTALSVASALGALPVRISNVSALAQQGDTNYGVSIIGANPIVTNLTATAAFGQEATAVRVKDGLLAVTLTDVVAIAHDASTVNTGVKVEGSAEVTITNLSATSTGFGSDVYGVWADSPSGSTTLVNSKVAGFGFGLAGNLFGIKAEGFTVIRGGSMLMNQGSNSTGLYIGDVGNMKVDDLSVTVQASANSPVALENHGFTAVTNSILNTNFFGPAISNLATGFQSLRVAGTQLVGTVSSPTPGALKCFNNFDNSLNAVTC